MISDRWCGGALALLVQSEVVAAKTSQFDRTGGPLLAPTNTQEKKEKSRTHEEVDVFSAMDVTVYPPPPQPLAASDHTRLGQISYSDPAFGSSKVSRENRDSVSYSFPMVWQDVD